MLGGQGRICRGLGFKQAFKSGKDLERWKRGRENPRTDVNTITELECAYNYLGES